MATLVSVNEIRGRTGNTNVTPGGVNGEETRKYQVIYDGVDVASDDVKNATGVPPYYSVLAGTNKYLLGKRADQLTDNSKIWIVTCSFQIPQPGQNPKADGATKWNIKISGRSAPYEIETQRDWSGKAIANSAKELFTPYQKFEFSDEILSVTYDTNSPNWGEISTYPGYWNDSAVTLTIKGVDRVFALGSMKYESYEWSETIDSAGAGAVTITLQFRIRTLDIFKPDSTDDPSSQWYPWRLAMPDIGFNETDGAGGLKEIVNRNNIPISVPQGLDGSGHKIALGAHLHVLQFDMFKSHSFDTLLAGIGT